MDTQKVGPCSDIDDDRLGEEDLGKSYNEEQVHQNWDEGGENIEVFGHGQDAAMRQWWLWTLAAYH